MKKADIQIGEEYAIGLGYDAEIDRPKRGRVLEFDVERRVPTEGVRMHYHTGHDGIKVEYLDKETGKVVGSQFGNVVTSRHILRPWPEQAEINAHVLEQREKSKEKEAADEAILNGINETLGANLYTRGGRRVEVPLDLLERLVQKAYERDKMIVRSGGEVEDSLFR